MQRAALLALAAAALALAVLAGAFGGTRAQPPGEVVFSMLAVGDTGEEPTPRTSPGQAEVARAMTDEDRAHPVDALVLLGDQFYPVGLLRRELVLRVRENVVRPYCHFLDLAAPRSGEVAGACPAEARGHVVPIHVLLGNHDYMSDASPQLQREVVPDFVANWRVPAGVVEVVQAGPGVSLILLDTLALLLRPERVAEVRDALASAPGPWRIMAGHQPVAAIDHEEDVHPRNRRLRVALERAIAESAVPVHLYLSGHEHNLQVALGSRAAPALHVIAGGGSSEREVENGAHGPAIARESLGFARVDLVREGGVERLVVSLFGVGGLWPTSGERRRFARTSVDLRGRVDLDDRADRERDRNAG